jgi:hypothetical protein
MCISYTPFSLTELVLRIRSRRIYLNSTSFKSKFLSLCQNRFDSKIQIVTGTFMHFQWGGFTERSRFSHERENDVQGNNLLWMIMVKSDHDPRPQIYVSTLFFGVTYLARVPRAGAPWFLYKTPKTEERAGDRIIVATFSYLKLNPSEETGDFSTTPSGSRMLSRLLLLCCRTVE